MKHIPFRLFTGVLKAWSDEATGDRYVSGTTSSTIRDLQGDELTLAALESMRLSALDNMTVFLNHGTKVPEDVFGSVTDAQIVKRLDPEEGEVHDLDLIIRVAPEDENPRATKVFRAIANGRKLGLSIGALVTKADRRSEGGAETIVIDGVRLLESSVVGIPANQRSYILTRALKALRGVPPDASEEGLDPDLEVRGLGDRVRAGILRNETAAGVRVRAAAESQPITAEDDMSPDTDDTTTTLDEEPAEGAPEATTEPAAPIEEPEPTAEATAEADPATEDEPEPTAEAVLASLMPVTEKATDALKALVEQAAALRTQVAELETALADRDAQLGTALELLTEALKLPVGRKAAVSAVTQKATAYPWLAPAVAAALDA